MAWKITKFRFRFVTFTAGACGFILANVAIHIRTTLAAQHAPIVIPAHQALNIEWEKVIISGGLAIVFSAIGSLSLWLLFRKVGHRRLLLEAFVFLTSLAIYQAEVAANLYLHGVNYATGWRRAACIAGIVFMAHAWQQRYNIGRTLEVSEEKDVHRHVVQQDKEDDNTMAHEFQMEAVRIISERAEQRTALMQQQ